MFQLPIVNTGASVLSLSSWYNQESQEKAPFCAILAPVKALPYSTLSPAELISTEPVPNFFVDVLCFDPP